MEEKIEFLLRKTNTILNDQRLSEIIDLYLKEGLENNIDFRIKSLQYYKDFITRDKNLFENIPKIDLLKTTLFDLLGFLSVPFKFEKSYHSKHISDVLYNLAIAVNQNVSKEEQINVFDYERKWRN